MGLSGLDIALSGLNIAQRQLSVISSNISNASTPGYSRKILPQETIVSGTGGGLGVKAGVITRNVDLNLTRDFWTQVSQVEALDVKASYLERIQQFHGAPDDAINIAAELAQLKDAFSTLADSPEDTYLQRLAVDQAVVFADKVNDLEDLLTQMRNDAQEDMELAVSRVNTKLSQIAELNGDIKFAQASGRSSATLEDQRDRLLEELSNDIEISFFTRGDGVLVVQTAQGEQLADELAVELHFNGTPIGALNTYPGSVSALTIGDPDTNPNATDITRADIGGTLGALIELRDEILPEQQAQLDELAHQVSRRFEEQGLRLFTDASGQVRSDAAPSPPTPVDYVGLSNEFRVNDAILNDNTLIQTGTVATDNPVQSGSNEVIRRVVEFVFGDVEFQQAIGTVDLSVGNTIQETIGVYSEAKVTSSIDMSQYSNLNALITAAGGALDTPTDRFTITFDDPDMTMAPIGAVAKTIELDLSVIAASPGDAVTQLTNAINNALTAPPAIDPLWDVQVSFNSNGQLDIQSRGNIIIDASGANGMTDVGLAFLGLQSGTFEAEDPYIDIQIGNDNSQRVTIGPLDTVNELYDKLDYDGGATDEGVFGLAVDPELNTGDGILRLRPGDSYTNPTFGGDLKIVGGPFETAGGLGIVEALFGTAIPVSNSQYSSQDANGNPVAFRSNNLGPEANINTGIISSSSIIDFAQKMINRQTEESVNVKERQVDEESFRDLMEERILNESGVNIEEELANLVRIQTAFAAASRVVQAIDEEFRSFLNSI